MERESVKMESLMGEIQVEIPPSSLSTKPSLSSSSSSITSTTPSALEFMELQEIMMNNNIISPSLLDMVINGYNTQVLPDSVDPSPPDPTPPTASDSNVKPESSDLHQGVSNNHHNNQPTTPNSSSVSSASNEAGSEEQQQQQSNKPLEEEREEQHEEEQQSKDTKDLTKAKKTNQKRQREPRFAFMTRSEVDHLEDGYRWRKYGQKAVKNSPFPRSYYRCTSASCNVKKRVERSFTDPSIVVTTYEGQHTHPCTVLPRAVMPVIPASAFSGGATTAAAVTATATSPYAMQLGGAGITGNASPHMIFAPHNHHQLQTSSNMMMANSSHHHHHHLASFGNFSSAPNNAMLLSAATQDKGSLCGVPANSVGLLRDNGLLQDMINVPSIMKTQQY